LTDLPFVIGINQGVGSSSFCVRKGDGKNCDIFEDSAVAEGGFTVTKMCISTAAAVGEMTADGDEAMVVVVFCFVRDCAETASVLVYGTVPLPLERYPWYYFDYTTV
jgi:hypothetical protein